MAVLLTILFRNKKTRARQKKTQRNVKLFQLFSVSKNEERNIEDIPTEELNEYVSDFIISVKTKDGKDYERSSLTSKITSKLRATSQEKKIPCKYYQCLGI